MKTQNRVSIGNFIRSNILLDLRFKTSLLMGRFSQYLERSSAFLRSYRSATADANRSRLSQSQIEFFTQRESDTVTPDYEALYHSQRLSDENVARQETRHSQVAVVVGDLLQREGLKSVLNIGARIDLISGYLARKHPTVRFTSVDFQQGLEKRNAFLGLCDNWRFVSGYALDVLETGDVRSDVVMFVSTSVVFTNAELRAYMKALSRWAKYVVLNEPYFHPTDSFRWFKLYRPEDIDSSKSRIGGDFNYYLHNYPAILASCGFEVISQAMIDRTDGDRTAYRLQIVAKNQTTT